MYLHSVNFTLSLLINSPVDSSEFLINLQYCRDSNVSLCWGLSLSFRVSNNLFTFSHICCSTSVYFFIDYIPSIPSQNFIIRIFQQHLCYNVLLKIYVLLLFLNFFSSMYLFLAFQLNTGHLRKGPLLWLVPYILSFSSGWTLCLLPSVLIADTTGSASCLNQYLCSCLLYCHCVSHFLLSAFIQSVCILCWILLFILTACNVTCLHLAFHASLLYAFNNLVEHVVHNTCIHYCLLGGALLWIYITTLVISLYVHLLAI